MDQNIVEKKMYENRINSTYEFMKNVKNATSENVLGTVIGSDGHTFRIIEDAAGNKKLQLVVNNKDKKLVRACDFVTRTLESENLVSLVNSAQCDNEEVSREVEDLVR